MIRKIPDDSDRNYDIVHMLKKIAIGLESKNVDDLRAIAHELEAVSYTHLRAHET